MSCRLQSKGVGRNSHAIIQAATRCWRYARLWQCGLLISILLPVTPVWADAQVQIIDDPGSPSTSNAAPAHVSGSHQTGVVARQDNRGMYAEIAAGYAGTYYKNAFGGDNNWRDGSGNAAMGALIGYQFRRHLGLEFGYHYIMPSKAINDTAGYNAADYSKANLQLVHGAFKMVLPIFTRVDLFGKAGLAYVHQTISSHGAGADGAITQQPRTRARIGAMFALGASYTLSEQIYMNVSYQRFAGEFKAQNNSASSIEKQIPNANLFMLGVGYYFGQ